MDDAALNAAPPSPPREADVVILGAGPAGLSAASRLTDTGRSVVLVELSDAPGGLCRTYERQGFHFDLGGHRFITRNRELYEQVRGLLEDDLQVRERESVIRIEGREYRYPLDLHEVLRGERLGGVTRILASYTMARLRSLMPGSRPRPAASETLESWIRSHFGSKIYDRFFREYTRKLWGMDAEALSADWAGSRISDIRLGDFITHALGARRKDPPRTFARKYCYPRHGIGQIFSTLAERTARAGARFLYRSTATRIHPGERFQVDLRTPQGDTSIRAGNVISTIPLPDLAALLPVPAAVQEAAARLTFRSLRFVNLCLEGPQLSSRTWVYVPEKDFAMTRVQFPANRSAANCPPQKTSVQLEIPCNHGDTVWGAGDDELVERSVKDLKALGFDVSNRVIASFTTRARHAYPVYSHGYREDRAVVLDWVRRVPGLETCGRQGGFNYIFFDRAMEDGQRAAGTVAGMPPSVTEERPPAGARLLPEEAHSIIEDSLETSRRGR